MLIIGSLEEDVHRLVLPLSYLHDAHYASHFCTHKYMLGKTEEQERRSVLPSHLGSMVQRHATWTTFTGRFYPNLLV